MFSQSTKNTSTTARRGPAANNNNMEYSQVTNNDQSLFFSIPTFPVHSEVHHHHQPQPIVLETSTHNNHHNQYNQYENEDDDDGDYQSSAHDSSFLYGMPIDIFQEDQSVS